ncbi:Protein of unknown function [Pyronema omphalodes CBS 100304]|uniref:Uncharacterized protein n=1 Tax=Pyronema omphalodes (strain CBS 100304) TaxID=1076935 RepID=U4LIE6_PYROM|nr:Protein of unknown function [Pyronema omphalodes CBS 100304]
MASQDYFNNNGHQYPPPAHGQYRPNNEQYASTVPGIHNTTAGAGNNDRGYLPPQPQYQQPYQQLLYQQPYQQPYQPYQQPQYMPPAQANPPSRKKGFFGGL